MPSGILELVASRAGHFRLESGHHAERWLDLERLCMDVQAIERHANELADRLARHSFDVVCGPLVEGAFIALIVARRLSKPFVYAERLEPVQAAGLFGVRYEIPQSLRLELAGRRLVVVNDFTSAGSAVRGTVRHVRACGGVVAAVGSLIVLGDAAAGFCEQEGLPLETLHSLPFAIWEPSICPLCAVGEPLIDPFAAASSTANRAGGR